MMRIPARSPLGIGLAIFVLGVLNLFTSGCAKDRQLPPTREPVIAQCDAMCYTPCVNADGSTGIQWDGTPVDPAMWDSLASDVTFTLADKLRQCDVQRKACVQCLNRLEAQKVIVQ